jgi:hypothetical protein
MVARMEADRRHQSAAGAVAADRQAGGIIDPALIVLRWG